MNVKHHRRIKRKIERQHFGNRWVTRETYWRRFLARYRYSGEERFRKLYDACWQINADLMFPNFAGQLAAKLAEQRAIAVGRAMGDIDENGNSIIPTGGVIIPGPRSLVGERGPDAWVKDVSGKINEITRTMIAVKVKASDPFTFDPGMLSRLQDNIKEDRRRREDALIASLLCGPFEAKPDDSIPTIDVDVIFPEGLFTPPDK